MSSDTELHLKTTLKDLRRLYDPHYEPSEDALAVTDEDGVHLAGRLREILKDADSESERGLLASLMLHDELGILCFLRETTDPVRPPNPRISITLNSLY